MKHADLTTLTATFPLVQDLIALNNTLGKPISTSADSVAPENPQQDATADGYGNTTAAMKPASARTTTHSSGSNPFRQ